ncbi:MAG: DUF4177 domain-containing protein [Bacteroidales bacterium]|nr:DUF4177 domain-containing protein [Bacteroidales bacterium]
MKKIITLLTLVMILSLTSCTQKWQYKVIRISGTEQETLPDFQCKTININDQSLNELGREGWELVDIYTETETVHPNYGNSEYVTGLQPNVRTAATVFVFKKEGASRQKSTKRL